MNQGDQLNHLNYLYQYSARITMFRIYINTVLTMFSVYISARITMFSVYINTVLASQCLVFISIQCSHHNV